METTEARVEYLKQNIGHSLDEVVCNDDIVKVGYGGLLVAFPSEDDNYGLYKVMDDGSVDWIAELITSTLVEEVAKHVLKPELPVVVYMSVPAQCDDSSVIQHIVKLR